eukprot:CAMPEP_0185832822 /NCGR_PEP_ID=MMETSP1353-20130828/2312_1 /TAXON_ID=1077150 /ORGANISM="Erythrolobus australicus, Strain CCMP3124" /LENGTH=99 /DNA_ID=CAMNT_0028531049 /DNA_START=23 /DNA_END=319 /DNA_ORIENTATION=+
MAMDDEEGADAVPEGYVCLESSDGFEFLIHVECAMASAFLRTSLESTPQLTSSLLTCVTRECSSAQRAEDADPLKSAVRCTRRLLCDVIRLAVSATGRW